MRKTVALVLSAVLSISLLAGCQQEASPQSQPQNRKNITIPPVFVDLQSPENRAEVPADEESTVYDAQGNALTEAEWLLNSKFAKSYIQKLGVGTYSFTYESASATGIITLTVTDEAAPNYLFAGEISAVVNYRAVLTLPELVMEQDSYQADCPVSYSLKKGEEAVALTEGFITPALTEGAYTWTATAIKDSQPYEFSQSFRVQTFREYLTAMENQLLLDNQEKEYLSAQDGVYFVDTLANVGDFFYTVNPEVLELALIAGVERVTFTVSSDRPLTGGQDGSIWISNNWNGFVFGIQGETPLVDDRTSASNACRFAASVDVREGKYIYTGVIYVDAERFTEAQPLTLQFNFAKCLAEVTVAFE